MVDGYSKISLIMTTINTTFNHDDDASVLYTSALAALMSSEHQAITKEAIEKTSQRRTRTVHDMHTYMQRIGLLNEKLQPFEESKDTGIRDDDDDGTISVIHVAGTKGKGSVCAMCEVMVRKNQPNVVTGLFTSPHLVDIRERIRINGLPISKSVFGQAYWHIRKLLQQYDNGNNADDGDDDDELPTLPGYFRMITLMALYIFKHYRSDDETKLRVTCIVLEVGMGGRYDATNVRLPWTHPTTVCGITLIDYDHVRILGNTLPAIAWEKSGIYIINKGVRDDDNNSNDAMTPHPTREQEQFTKAVSEMYSNGETASLQQSSTRRRCFALDTNDKSVIDVFRLCAINEGQGDVLILTGPSHDPQLPSHHVELGLKGTHQRDNAELAIAMCRAILDQNQNEGNTIETKKSQIYEALYDMTWPGRCQTEEYSFSDTTQQSTDIPITIRLDGAHTIQSMRAGFEWYNSVTNRATNINTNSTGCCRILVFNCSHERNPVELLDLLYNSKTTFHAVYFCRADSERPSAIAKSSAMELWQASNKKNEMTDPEVLRAFRGGSSAETPTWQDTLLGIWNLLEVTSSPTLYKAMDRASNLTCTEAIQRGYDFVQAHANEFTSIELLCTGSLYLVGSMLTAIHWQEKEATGSLVTNTKLAL